MLELLFIGGLATWGYLTYVRTRSFLHILQLEEYFTRQFLRWLGAHPGRYLRTMAGLVGAPVAALLVLVGDDALAAGALAAWALIAVAILYLKPRRKRDWKPLVMTTRARRLLVVSLVLTALGVASVTGLGLLAGAREGIAAGLLTLSLLCAMQGHVLALANLVLYPIEESTRRRFQVMASRKLAERAPKVIAITGSAGKTTTKELVAHMLSARFRVLRTPSSFNTPMGISRTVNDALTDQDYFVVEMGAYQRGEIEKLCRLVGGADISVITTVNAQHLERFGSLEKTAEAKFEIVDGLKPGGTAVLNFDVPAVRAHAAARPGLDVLTFGIESSDVRLRATSVREQEGGIELDVSVDGETAALRVPLLGRHNAGNVLAAIGVGLSCGLDLPYMAAALRQAHAPEHRLQPLKLQTGGILLDDGYNANPAGIIGALEVLGSYAPKRRILITPGLIEMGRDKARYHGDIGRAAAAQVDVAVLVGPNQTADIRDGLLGAGFPEANVQVVRSMDEARDAVSAMGGWSGNSVVLIANDVPDQFDEFLSI